LILKLTYIFVPLDFKPRFQDFISLTMRGIMDATDRPHTEDLDTMVLRFFKLFEAHDIATADIPDFLPPDTLSRSELRYNDKILDCLTVPVIEHLVDLFHVDVNWLLGKSDYIYKTQRFYKSLPTILAEITRQKHRHYQGVEVLFLTVDGIRLEELAALKDDDDSTDRYTNIHVVLKVDKVVNRHKITTYQLWDSLPWNYWRSRHHAKALIYFCDKTRVYPTAYNLDAGLLNELVSGKGMLPRIPNEGKLWHVEELAWNDERNTELDELKTIKEYFIEQRGKPYLIAARDSSKIQNYDAFMAGNESPQLLEE